MNTLALSGMKHTGDIIGRDVPYRVVSYRDKTYRDKIYRDISIMLMVSVYQFHLHTVGIVAFWALTYEI